MTEAPRGLGSALPGRASPAMQCSRTAANGGKDKAGGLLRGLHSVFSGTQLDHPLGPLTCFTVADMYAHKHTAKRTHWVSALSDTETLCYLLLVSFVCLDHLETPFVDAASETTGRGSVKELQTRILARRCSSAAGGGWKGEWGVGGFWTIKRTDGVKAEFLTLKNQ